MTYRLQPVERTTVYLDEATKKLLKAAARRRHITEAEIIREALALHLRPRRQGNPRAVGRSTDQGVAQRIDEALAELGFGRSAG